MTIIIKIGTLFLSLIYGLLKLLPQKKKIVFLSRQSDEPSLDIKMLKNKISELHPDYETVILCKKLKADPLSMIKYMIHMFAQMYHLATSKIAILDSYCILASILNHKNNLLVIQMWHSIGTLKKFGYSILDKPEGSSSKMANLMKMHHNYSYILCGGDGYRDHLAQGFNYPLEKIITMPLPRVEVLKSNEYKEEISEKIFSKYPLLKEKKNIVYVPTFRKTDDNAFDQALLELCASVDYGRYNLVIKAHPLTDLSNFNDTKAIIDKSFSSFDMLFISDIIITDYSCIMYEAAILGKPLYFYTYDYDEYMSTRDIYIDYKKEMPGPICNNSSELIEAIDKGSYDYQKLNSFLNKYVYMGSKHESEDIIRFMFDHIG